MMKMYNNYYMTDVFNINYMLLLIYIHVNLRHVCTVVPKGLLHIL